MRSKELQLGALTRVIATGAAALTYAAYRKDITAARHRIETNRQVIDSAHGPIEFAESGDGPAVLVIHGAGGGFDQGLDLGRDFLGGTHRLIAPSRFGYLGTPLPADASAEAQADAHRQLLDALSLDRLPVIGVSAGAPSAMQLCLRHPERCSALALIVPLAYAPRPTARTAPSRVFRTTLDIIAASDVLFWAATKVAHSALLNTILGTPVENYRHGTSAERRRVNQILRSILPISRRAAGIKNDAAVSSGLTPYHLEDIRVPTLVVSAADDLYRTYESGLYTAEQIHDGKFIGFSTGGHLLVGHEEEVRWQLTSFLNESLAARTATAMVS